MKELLRVIGLKKYFPSRDGKKVRAVDGVSLSVNESEVFALVGESGCGKSTIARLILRLMIPTEGDIYFDNINVLRAKGEELSRIRRGMQIIFQDPQASLNPRKRVIDTVGEPLIINGIVRKSELKEHVINLLQRVGIGSDSLYKYPHEFSGGQRQRICIARALAVNPRLLVADEPTSALDVSIQAQVINLLEELQKEKGMAYLFISHNLPMVEHFSDTIAVMYLGRIVEMAETEDFFGEPLHPYSDALLNAVPKTEIGQRGKRVILKGDVPSPLDIPSGCPFHPRCPRRFSPCDKIVPVFREVRNGRWVSCHLYN
ncbi:MAG: dipeptide ABC transporter ATP-binding protein [Thermodesulfovibrionia bacterium]